MTSETFAVQGLLLMLTAIALLALGISVLVAAVPLGASVALAFCAAHEELVARASRRPRH